MRSAAASFAATLDPASGPHDADALEPVVAVAWQRARDAYPELGVSAAELFAYAGARIRDRDPAAELARRCIADLYLACACDRGDATGLALLERHVVPVVERGIASFADRGELIQILRERMLVDRDGRRGIGAYDGRAPLAVWLRVCATRIGIRQADRDKHNTELDDRRLDELAPGVPDPELAYLKRLYGAQFRTAFGDAVASLAPRERTLLRHSVIDGLGIDQIAAIYHVHRATAARQLAHARESLIGATRERMRVALGIGERELESIMRMIQSMADITLRDVFAPRRLEKSE